MPLLTLFTAPKPFTDPHIHTIQRNTLLNWLALGDDVAVVVIGDEPGIAEVCSELGLCHLPDVRCNALGTPLISSIFSLARDVNQSPFLAYANADILFLPELAQVIHTMGEKKAHFLGVGQRWDVDITTQLDFSGAWGGPLRFLTEGTGQLHGQTGSDFFIYPRECFQEIPDFAVGRAGWDNWMLYWARRQGWALVDFTQALMVIHQNHDYRHLPGGEIHYRLPETMDNIKLAGGKRSIFALTDAAYDFDGKALTRKPLTWQRFWREVEIFPLVKLHCRVLGWLSFAIFHPAKAFRETKRWLAGRRKRDPITGDSDKVR